MPFNEELFRAPATRGDVAGVAIAIARVIYTLDGALADMASNPGGDITAHRAELLEIARRADRMFDELTGWTKNER